MQFSLFRADDIRLSTNTCLYFIIAFRAKETALWINHRAVFALSGYVFHFEAMRVNLKVGNAASECIALYFFVADFHIGHVSD